MSKEKFPPKPNESGMLFYLYLVYGSGLKRSDLNHLGCGGSYKKYVNEGIFKEEDKSLNPKITIPDYRRKLE